MSSPTTASRSRSWRRLPRDLLVEALAFLDFRDYCVGAVRTSRDLATTFDRVRLRVATLVDPGSSPARDTLMRMIERCPRVEVIRPAREKYRDREFMVSERADCLEMAYVHVHWAQLLQFFFTFGNQETLENFREHCMLHKRSSYIRSATTLSF